MTMHKELRTCIVETEFAKALVAISAKSGDERMCRTAQV